MNRARVLWVMVMWTEDVIILMMRTNTGDNINNYSVNQIENHDIYVMYAYSTYYRCMISSIIMTLLVISLHL